MQFRELDLAFFPGMMTLVIFAGLLTWLLLGILLLVVQTMFGVPNGLSDQAVGGMVLLSLLSMFILNALTHRTVVTLAHDGQRRTITVAWRQFVFGKHEVTLPLDGSERIVVSSSLIDFSKMMTFAKWRQTSGFVGGVIRTFESGFMSGLMENNWSAGDGACVFLSVGMIELPLKLMPQRQHRAEARARTIGKALRIPVELRD